MRIVHILAAGAIALSASPASATITTIVLTGVASGSDNGHLNAPSPFGMLQLGVDLGTGTTFGTAANQTFSLVLRLDESLGALDDFPDGQQRYGSGADSPLSAAFTMNGFTYEFGGAEGSFGKAFQNPDFVSAYATEARLRPPMTGDFTNVVGALDFALTLLPGVFQSKSFSEPVDWTRAAGESGVGHLVLSLQDTTGTPLAYALGPVRTADLSLRFDRMIISAVPEPSTWALMLLGFGLAGAGVRRRAAALRA